MKIDDGEAVLLFGDRQYLVGIRGMARLLRERGQEARAYSIETLASGEADRLIGECSVAGFGYPIYGSDLPQPMKEFIDTLKPVQGKPAFGCWDGGTWDGGTGPLSHHILTIQCHQ